MIKFVRRKTLTGDIGGLVSFEECMKNLKRRSALYKIVKERKV